MNDAITIPEDIKPADGRFGAGPSKIRTEALDALAATGQDLEPVREAWRADARSSSAAWALRGGIRAPGPVIRSLRRCSRPQRLRHESSPHDPPRSPPR